jgi:predicted RNase H-like HicB family nuclease
MRDPRDQVALQVVLVDEAAPAPGHLVLARLVLLRVADEDVVADRLDPERRVVVRVDQRVQPDEERRYLTTMSEPLQLTVVYEEGEEGFVLARIREVPAAMSQGRTHREARENVLDALRELVLSFLEEGEPAPLGAGASSEPLRVTFAE